MGIETASYINTLNSSNPLGTDPLGNADEHIRLIKSVLKNTFPNITGPITSTQSQLNVGVVPTGAIIMWSGAYNAIPSGWALCDGSVQAKIDGTGNVTLPDLRDRFIIGAGAGTGGASLYPVGQSGGANSHTLAINNFAYALTTANLPAHNHAVTVVDPGHNHSVTDPGHSHTYYRSSNGGNKTNAGSQWAFWLAENNAGVVTTNSITNISIQNKITGITASTANVGSGTAHSHDNSLSYDGATGAATINFDNRPKYYALCFIYKL